MNLSPRARERVALQKARYLQSLPDKKMRIEDCWRALHHHGWTPELSGNLITEVHRLSGSAGSYGFSALSQAAQKLDLLLARDVIAGTSGSEHENLIEALLDAIDQVIDRAH